MFVKKTLLGTMRSVAIVVAAATGVVTVTAAITPSVAYAEKAKQTFSQKVGKPLKEAQDLMGQKKWKEALDKINNEIVPIAGKTAQEEAAVNEFKVYCLAQLKDNLGAAKVIETMLAAGQIAPDQVSARVLTLTQVYFQQKDYAKAIQYGERYIKENGATGEVLNIVMQSYYQKADYKTASEYAQKQIKIAEQAKRPPEKDVLAFLMSSQFKLDNSAGVTSALEALLTYYPTPDYWRDIFIYLKKEASYSEKENIEIYRLKKAVGVLEPEGYLDLAELSLAMNDPGDAKEALESGSASGAVKPGERVTRLLTKAKADAAQDLATLDATDKEARTKPTGDSAAKIGAAYLGHGLYDKAISSIQFALSKGGVEALDQAYVRLGVAYLNTGKKAEAIKAFKSVPEKSKLARLAHLWIIHAEKQK